MSSRNGSAEAAGLDAPPQWWELCLYDVQGAAVLGADRSLLASGRLDNLLSCWAAATALTESDPTDSIAVIVLNDHEEVGSASATGAAGPFLQTVLSRLVAARGGSDDDLHRSFATSACISADNAHAVHPNYPERHEPDHRPIVNAGPAIKVNANQRYATSAETAGLFQTGVRTGGRSVAGLRVTQQHAVRVDDRAGDGHAAGHPDRRRRCPSAVDALGT